MTSKNTLRKQSALDKIDSYFEKQPKNIFLMCIFLVVLVVGYLVYDYFYEDSEAYLNEQQTELQKATDELNSLDNYINMQKTQNTIARLQSDLSLARERYESVQRDNQYFDAKLREVSRVLYNQENWSRFISKLISSSRENNIKTIGIKSRRNDFGMQKIQEAFNVEFDVAGRYQDIIAFINDLERSLDVVDVKEIKITQGILNDTNSSHYSSNQQMIKPEHQAINQKVKLSTQAHLSISIWGLKY